MKHTFNHADFAQPIQYEAMTLPGDSADGQVTATICLMRRYALEDSRSPAVASLAQALLQQCDSADDYLQRVFAETQSRMYFQRDELTGEPIAGDDTVEVLLRPADVITLSDMGQPVPGDCDCFSMFVASLLLAGGVDCAFATISGSPSEPQSLSHVYVVAWPQTAYRTVLDASHGKVVGWEAPNCGRYQEWPVGAMSVSTGAGGGAYVLGLLLTLGGLLLFFVDHNERNSGSGGRGSGAADGAGTGGMFAGELAA